MENKSQKQKKIPIRQCLGCNTHRPKKELIRVVRSPDGEISLDFVGKKSGRGAYICPSRTCFSKARKTKRIENVLECQIPEQIYDEMEKSISSADEG